MCGSELGALVGGLQCSCKRKAASSSNRGLANSYLFAEGDASIHGSSARFPPGERRDDSRLDIKVRCVFTRGSQSETGRDCNQALDDNSWIVQATLSDNEVPQNVAIVNHQITRVASSEVIKAQERVDEFFEDVRTRLQEGRISFFVCSAAAKKVCLTRFGNLHFLRHDFDGTAFNGRMQAAVLLREYTLRVSATLLVLDASPRRSGAIPFDRSWRIHAIQATMDLDRTSGFCRSMIEGVCLHQLQATLSFTPSLGKPCETLRNWPERCAVPFVMSHAGAGGCSLIRGSRSVR